MTTLDTLADAMGEALTKLHRAYEKQSKAKDPRDRRDAIRLVIKASRAHQAARRQYELAKRNITRSAAE